MGLTGFYGLLQKQGQYLPTNVTLAELKGKTIALDGDFFIYKAMHGSTTGDAFTATDIGKRISQWLTLASDAGIRTIFVTTGGMVPIEKINHCEVQRKRKRDQQQTRIDIIQSHLETKILDQGEEILLQDQLCRMRDGIRKVNRSMSSDVVQYLRTHGFDCRVGVSEADFLLVLLAENGSCDMVATDDADIIVSGAHTVIRDLVKLLLRTSQTGRLYHRKDILSHLKLTSMQFVQLGVLMSCDYQPPLKNVGPVTALRMIRTYGSVDKFLESSEFNTVTKNKKRKYSTPCSMTKEDYIKSSQRSVDIMTSRPDRDEVLVEKKEEENGRGGIFF
jgi:flap endonuclease-1